MDELPVSDVDAAVGSGTGGEIRILKVFKHRHPRPIGEGCHRPIAGTGPGAQIQCIRRHLSVAGQASRYSPER